LIVNELKNKPNLGLYLKLWLIYRKYLKMKREKVHSVDVFWDGPMAGVADFAEKIHYFDVVEDDAELADGSLNFTLIALGDEIYQSISENIEIKASWQKACDSGTAEIDTEPALPEDRDRFDVNRNKIHNYLLQNQSKAILKKGIFYQNESGYEVEWC
jgi:hypothetical protein